MADPLAITSAAPPMATACVPRAATPSGGGEPSNFAQVLHEARDDRSSGACEAQATASAPAPSTSASATPEDTTAVEQSSATQATGAHASVLGGVQTLPSVASEPAAEIVGPADAVASSTLPVGPQLASPHLATSAVSTDGTSAEADRAKSSEAAKQQLKKHSLCASDGEKPLTPAQTAPATNIADAVVAAPPAALPASCAVQANGTVAPPHRATPMSGSRPAAALQPGSSVGATDISVASLPAGASPVNQQTGDVDAHVPATVSFQQGVQTAPAAITAVTPPPPFSLNAAGPMRTPQLPRATKKSASSDEDGAPDLNTASPALSLVDKGVDVGAPAAVPLPFGAASFRHAPAESAVFPGVQPLNTHAAFHPSQGSAMIGSDLQANSTLPQPAGETPARSNALEVGFHDANLGWLSVRASTDVAGGLHAAVSAKTPAALAAVDTMLPALGRFLQQESVAVHSVSTTGVMGGGLLSGVVGGGIAVGFSSAPDSQSASAGSSQQQQQQAGRNAPQRDANRDSATGPSAISKAVTTPASAGMALRYSEAEHLSTVSVRI